jgi:hypothetical protein
LFLSGQSPLASAQRFVLALFRVDIADYHGSEWDSSPEDWSVTDIGIDVSIAISMAATTVRPVAPGDTEALCSLAFMPWQRPNIGSRVTREGHARFWERPRVKLPRATRQIYTDFQRARKRGDGRNWPNATSDILTARRRFRAIAEMDRFSSRNDL